MFWAGPLVPSGGGGGGLSWLVLASLLPETARLTPGHISSLLYLSQLVPHQGGRVRRRGGVVSDSEVRHVRSAPPSTIRRRRRRGTLREGRSVS